MPINIKRKCGGSVAQVALKCLDVIAVADRDNSVLMPKIMEAEIGTTHAFDDALEAIIDSTISCDSSTQVTEPQ